MLLKKIDLERAKELVESGQEAYVYCEVVYGEGIYPVRKTEGSFMELLSAFYYERKDSNGNQ